MKFYILEFFFENLSTKLKVFLKSDQNSGHFTLRQTNKHVEIKCQLDATDDFYCRSHCLLNMFRAPLCPSSGARRVLYKWLLPVVFGALVFKLSVRCGAEGYVSGLRAATAAR
jgi:hypothetical protein